MKRSKCGILLDIYKLVFLFLKISLNHSGYIKMEQAVNLNDKAEQ